MKKPKRAVTELRIWHRLLLLVYPRSFRRKWGPDFVKFLSCQRGEPRYSNGVVGALRYLVEVLADAVATGIELRAAAVVGGLGRGGRQRMNPSKGGRSMAGSEGDLMGGIPKDVRYGLRTMRKHPLFTAAAVLTLGLGIGATTAIFSVVNAVLLKPLPYADSDRVVTVWQTAPSWSESPNPILQSLAYEFPVSWETFQDWLELNSSFDALGVHSSDRTYAVTGENVPDLVTGLSATSGVFETLGVAPLLGRTFLPADEITGATPLVILSFGFWVSRFGADSTVIGRSMMLNEVPHTIVGVMPRSFFFPSQTASLWKTVDDDRKKPRSAGQSFWGVARLNRGLPLELAQEQMEAVNNRINEAVPGREYGVRLVRRREDIVGEVRPILLILLGAVGVVLLVACANITNLLMARTSERRREFSVRCALGASRSRVFVQLLTESLLLAVAGGIVGLLLAFVSLGPLIATIPPALPRVSDIRLDGTVLLFSSIITLGTGMLVGAVPSIRAARSHHVSVSSTTGRSQIGGRSQNRTQHLFVISELALTFVLLVGAGLLARSMVRLSTVELGFEPSNVITMRIGFLGARYQTDEQRRVLFDELRERLEALPGVGSVAYSAWAPFVSEPWGGSIRMHGEAGPTDAVDASVSWNRVSPSFFETLRIPLVTGRRFGPGDYDTSAESVIISETMARYFWPGEDPIGKQFGKQFGRGRNEILTVVGVAGDIRHTGYGSDLTTEPRSLVYLPERDGRVFCVRALGAPSTTMVAVRNIAHSMDPDLPVVLANVNDEINRSLAGPRFRTWLVSLLAALAALLASIGVYGVLSYTVTQRTREIGIRMAMGATAPKLLGAVVRRGLALVSIGVVIGLVVAFNIGRMLESFLFEIKPMDPGSIVGVVVLLSTVGLVASWLPARRATRVDPVDALRQE